MARTYLMITQEEINIKIAQNIKSRENELASYDFEAAGHTAAIAALGDIVWTPATQVYNGLTRDTMVARAISEGLTDIQIAEIADLISLDLHKKGLQAVQIEVTKAERIYAHLLETLPAGPARDVAMATVV